MFDILLEIYVKYGYYKESLVNVVRKGKEGAEEIQKMMEGYRANPPKKINGSLVVKLHDYELSVSSELVTGLKTPISLPKSNVLQFLLEDGTKISVRPSGTEPKIKFYFSANEKMKSKADFEKVGKLLDERIEGIKRDMKLI